MCKNVFCFRIGSNRHVELSELTAEIFAPKERKESYYSPHHKDIFGNVVYTSGIFYKVYKDIRNDFRLVGKLIKGARSIRSAVFISGNMIS